MKTSEILRALQQVRSPSGEEIRMKEFIMEYVKRHAAAWRKEPIVIEGDDFLDCLILVFGKPEIAAFAHMDTTGFTVRYQDQLIPIGSPEVRGGEVLTGSDELGTIQCNLSIDEQENARYVFGRAIQSGTALVFKPDFNEEESNYIAPYLDNRIGICNLLKVAERLEHGALVFSCWEEHGGGSVPFLVKYLYEKYSIRKMLVSDVTWVTDGIQSGKGVVISYRDQNIPRRSFIDRIVQIAVEEGMHFQAEVEAYGSSDAREIQHSPYPIDWCFIGPPVEAVHSPRERISKSDFGDMIQLYSTLMKQL